MRSNRFLRLAALAAPLAIATSAAAEPTAVEYVVQQKAAFFAGEKKVDSREALAQMRKIRASVH